MSSRYWITRADTAPAIVSTLESGAAGSTHAALIPLGLLFGFGLCSLYGFHFVWFFDRSQFCIVFTINDLISGIGMFTLSNVEKFLSHRRIFQHNNWLTLGFVLIDFYLLGTHGYRICSGRFFVWGYLYWSRSLWRRLFLVLFDTIRSHKLGTWLVLVLWAWGFVQIGHTVNIILRTYLNASTECCLLVFTRPVI